MKPSRKAVITLSFILAFSAGTLGAQPYSFDENGNGTQFIALNPHPLPFEVAADPSGGITTSPVLIYSLGETVVPGDVALMEPDGSTIAELLRFYTSAREANGNVIVYSQVNGSLAGVGIPTSANPFEISDVSPTTDWFPGGGQPGATTLVVLPVFEFFRYDVTTAVPEPSATVLLLAGTGVWLTVWGFRRKRFSHRMRLWL